MFKEQTEVTQAGEVWLALTVESTQGFYIAGYSYDALVEIHQ